VKAEAEKGQDFLRAMTAMDSGSCYLGEGALGTGYPETGNKNRSGLHWDLVCDLRKGGELYVDSELIQKNGQFLNMKFPQP
jgi:aminopeptidase